MDYFFCKFKRLIVSYNYLSITKLINWFKLAFSYFLSIYGFQKNHPKFPYFISVETTNFCNLHCPECPVGTKKNKTQISGFDFILYKKLIDELKPTLLHTILYFQGEPLLHKQLTEFIQYAHLAKIYTSTSTNAQFLTEEIAKKIVISGLDKLIISVDGSTQETYQSYRVGGNLQKTLEGIKEIVKWKKNLKSATPLVEIQFLVLKTNEHQMAEMKKLAKTLKVDRLTFKTAQLYDFEHGNELMPTKSKYSRYKKVRSGNFVIKTQQANRCWRLWGGAVVNVRGEVLPCCFDKASEYSFGNIQGNSFSECWHNKKASDFRGRILQNRKQFEICRNCTTK